MTAEHVDIVVSGGGVAGLTAAALFGQAGYSVVCVDPSAPVTERDVIGADLRSTAFLQPAKNSGSLGEVRYRSAMPLHSPGVFAATLATGKEWL